MKRFMPRIALAIPAIAAYGDTPSAAESEYVGTAKSAVVAFRCSVLAAHGRYNAEETRLLAYGMSEARKFISAVRTENVREDVLNRVDFIWPVVLRKWTFQPQQTSDDFVVGQVYESIWEETTGRLGEQSHDKSGYQTPARARFETENCSLVGPRS